MKGYPRRFYYWLMAAFAGLGVSGLVLTPTTLMLRFDTSLAWRIAAESRVFVAAVHAACGFVVSWIFGALWTVHIRAGWRQRRQLGSGLTLASALLGLILTGVGIYYLASDAWANAAAGLHVALGLGGIAVFGWHAWKGHRLRRRAARD
ncbi:hypothetical protein [Niveibacterium sp. SC-1]|uniref:hypothetical protein n=1 Tax=Niveibacterium sp. SC-1 TaxID=3135646 RepID=UPI00311E0087